MFLTASVLLCAQTVFGLELTSTLSAAVTEYDGAFNWVPGGNSVFTGMKSAHSNTKEDRIWRFYTTKVDGLTCVGGEWTGYQNDWDGVLNFNCGAGKAIAGIGAFHDNRKEDRRWRFKCCAISGGFKIVSTKMTDFVNAWDGPLDAKCNSDSVLVGVYSIHDNIKEDRRWKLNCGTLATEALTKMPTAMPTRSPIKMSPENVLEEVMDVKTALMGGLSRVLAEMKALKSEVQTELMDLKMQVASLQQKCTADDECEKAPPCDKNKGARKCKAAAGCKWDKSSDPAKCIEN